MPYKSKEDQAAASHRHYVKNKLEYQARSKINRDNVREWVQEYKSITPCADCNKCYPFYVMDFDHVNDDKAGNIGTMVASKRSWKMIKKEIDKCELVCANCHRGRTYKRYKLAGGAEAVNGF